MSLEVDPWVHFKDWKQIVGQIRESRYHISRDNPGKGHRALNPAHGFQINFVDNGPRLYAHNKANAAWELSFALSGYGYEGQIQAAGRP